MSSPLKVNLNLYRTAKLILAQSESIRIRGNTINVPDKLNFFLGRTEILKGDGECWSPAVFFFYSNNIFKSLPIHLVGH